MNVNNNVITYNTPTKVDTPKQPAKTEEFKKTLDNQVQKSSNSSNEDVSKTNKRDETLDKSSIKNPDKTNVDNQSDKAYKNVVDVNASKGLDDVDTSDTLSTEINKTIKKINDLLNQNIKNSAVEPADTDMTTDKMAQIQKLLQSLNSMIQKTDTTPATKTLVTQLNSIDLEGLIGKGKLTTEVKSTLKDNLNKMLSLLEKPSEKLVGIDQSTDEMAQIQQLLQSLTVMLQSTDKTTTTKTSGTELNLINLEELIGGEKLTTETKTTLKNNLSEMLSLLENSKGNNKVSSEILVLLKKLTTQVKDVKVDSNLLKVPTLETTKTTSNSISGSQMQNSSDSKKDNKSSGNSSVEEKFLNKLLSGDKDDVKISKAVNFMNQFQTVKTSDASKVISANLVIDKNNFEADVIKSIKFMEVNNIKDLTVKMNPRELGEITIKLTMESGIMKASILAQNKETYNLLNNNIQDIQDRLKNMDIKIQSLDINVYEDSTFFNKNSSGNNNNNNGKQDNNSKTNVDIDDDVAISSNNAIEDNQVNKFV
ncbi:flagellar hook-length control protein FliK [Clostridium estertheticum]|uniref:flagellar hook-length control protein FliK n=1 Tax=Clostridium estertheticum TaxID=238834 RepID=UPI001C6DE13E|nr:flagellar hook-length control protein FliK [Clostridium estertheticum]MBW9151940.1 flagellar hook-length control protein FliK [Clostridium estertheticum]WLC85322.1 flagellar hook-length control protein FliK [Clostridium estertheticum]